MPPLAPPPPPRPPIISKKPTAALPKRDKTPQTDRTYLFPHFEELHLRNKSDDSAPSRQEVIKSPEYLQRKQRLDKLINVLYKDRNGRRLKNSMGAAFDSDMKSTTDSLLFGETFGSKGGPQLQLESQLLRTDEAPGRKLLNTLHDTIVDKHGSINYDTKSKKWIAQPKIQVLQNIEAFIQNKDASLLQGQGESSTVGTVTTVAQLMDLVARVSSVLDKRVHHDKRAFLDTAIVAASEGVHSPLFSSNSQAHQALNDVKAMRDTDSYRLWNKKSVARFLAEVQLLSERQGMQTGSELKQRFNALYAQSVSWIDYTIKFLTAVHDLKAKVQQITKTMQALPASYGPLFTPPQVRDISKLIATLKIAESDKRDTDLLAVTRGVETHLDQYLASLREQANMFNSIMTRETKREASVHKLVQNAVKKAKAVEITQPIQNKEVVHSAVDNIMAHLEVNHTTAIASVVPAAPSMAQSIVAVANTHDAAALPVAVYQEMPAVRATIDALATAPDQQAAVKIVNKAVKRWGWRTFAGLALAGMVVIGGAGAGYMQSRTAPDFGLGTGVVISQGLPSAVSNTPFAATLLSPAASRPFDNVVAEAANAAASAFPQGPVYNMTTQAVTFQLPDELLEPTNAKAGDSTVSRGGYSSPAIFGAGLTGLAGLGWLGSHSKHGSQSAGPSKKRSRPVRELQQLDTKRYTRSGTVY